MNESIWLILAAVCTVLGMTWLSLSLKSHWQQVFPDERVPHIVRLRGAGWGFLLLSAISCFNANHPSMAVSLGNAVAACCGDCGYDLESATDASTVLLSGFFCRAVINSFATLGYKTRVF